MSNKDDKLIWELYDAEFDVDEIQKRLIPLIANWKREFPNWTTWTDEEKVDEFKRWSRDELANRPGGNTVQTGLPNDEQLLKMII